MKMPNENVSTTKDGFSVKPTKSKKSDIVLPKTSTVIPDVMSDSARIADDVIVFEHEEKGAKKKPARKHRKRP